jgi:hypothetical protein
MNRFHKKINKMQVLKRVYSSAKLFCFSIFWRQECVGHSLAPVAHFIDLREISGFEPKGLHQQPGALPTYPPIHEQILATREYMPNYRPLYGAVPTAIKSAWKEVLS